MLGRLPRKPLQRRAHGAREALLWGAQPLLGLQREEAVLKQLTLLVIEHDGLLQLRPKRHVYGLQIQSQTFDEFGVPPHIADLGEDLPLNDVERIDGLLTKRASAQVAGKEK